MSNQIFELKEHKEEGEVQIHTAYSLAQYAMGLLTSELRCEILDDYCQYCGVGRLCKACSEEKQNGIIKNDKNNY